jgi:AraC-like DNA-binding protein
MLSFTELAMRPEFTVTAVTCRGDHRGWSEVEPADDFRVVLVRQGRFRRMSRGVPVEVDQTLAYVGAPGDEEHFAHPAGGDVCTLITLSPALWRSLAGETAQPVRSTVYVDARLELTHRRFLTAASAGDIDFALSEELLDLLNHVIGQVVTGPTPAGADSPRSEHALVAAARRAVAEDHPEAGGLFPLAELLGVSPYRLSRAVSRELGVSLTRYRNRVRLGRALDRLEGGELSLALLAADLGFADQAHLSRTVSEHFGHTPTALRRLLTPPDIGEGVRGPGGALRAGVPSG